MSQELTILIVHVRRRIELAAQLGDDRHEHRARLRPERDRLNAAVAGLPMQFTGRGSMIGVHMTGAKLRSAADMKKSHAGLKDLFYFDLTAQGIWFAKRGFMALSIALEDPDAATLVAAVEEFALSRE